MNTQEILEKAKSVLELEGNAILQAAQKIDNNFLRAVELILQTKGRLILCGIGKSAHIAQKIVATLNSTGTPSLFLHAAEAMHGDLGMVQSGDVVIMISKSGNTPELKNLLPFLRATNCPIIAMVGNLQSYLAQHADFVIDASIEKEACPHDLAPTTSTTVTLALGDALAVTLLHLRNFSSEDFARYHPGGALGKRLSVKVKDIVSKDFPFVQISAGWKEVISSISKGKKGCSLVLDYRKVVGIVTDGDIRRALEKYELFQNLKVSDLMSSNPKSIDSEEFAYDALVMMEDLKISQLLVYHENELIGLVHLHDLLNVGLK